MDFFSLASGGMSGRPSRGIMAGGLGNVKGFFGNLPDSTMLITRRAKICNSALLGYYVSDGMGVTFINKCIVRECETAPSHTGASILSYTLLESFKRECPSGLGCGAFPRRTLCRLHRLTHRQRVLMRRHGRRVATSEDRSYHPVEDLTIGQDVSHVGRVLSARVTRARGRVLGIVGKRRDVRRGCRLIGDISKIKLVATMRLLMGARGFAGVAATHRCTTCTKATPCRGSSKGVSGKTRVSGVNGEQSGALLCVYTRDTELRGGRVGLCCREHALVSGGPHRCMLGTVTGGLLEVVFALIRGNRCCSTGFVERSPEIIGCGWHWGVHSGLTRLRWGETPY